MLLEFWRSFSQSKGALIGLAIIMLFFIVAVGAGVISPYDPSTVFSDAALSPPDLTSKYLLGTDDLGRDILSRLLYGARVSLILGLLIVFISALFGIVLGLTAGYLGGITDMIIMRFTDILMSLPSILLAIVVVSVLGTSLFNTVIAISIVSIPAFVRLVRASVLAEKRKNYVICARCFGASHFRIAFLNILPNCIAPITVQATLAFSDGILNIAALGFLGLGAQPPTPEWGTMLADARDYIISEPYLVMLPGLCILAVVISFNLVGDVMRDCLDAKLKKI
ncbi:MAG: ABC transporter permease subunit [Pseudomonadota bacterium]|nr:ABC transporter permease subunit [Pseudomonadota bacterium]